MKNKFDKPTLNRLEIMFLANLQLLVPAQMIEGSILKNEGTIKDETKKDGIRQDKTRQDKIQ